MLDYDYEIMVTDVTVGQYVAYLNQALADGMLRVDGVQVVGSYPGDEFRGVKHEVEISAGDYVFVPLDDPASRFTFDGIDVLRQLRLRESPDDQRLLVRRLGLLRRVWRPAASRARMGEGRPRHATIVPSRGAIEIARNQANFYASRDPFEDMGSFGSRTSPVGFYNGRSYDGYVTLDSASPYGLYDMAGNVWQWTGDVYEGQHYRYLRGGSKDTYEMDLRLWVRNNATPTYYSPGVGFRCARDVN